MHTILIPTNGTVLFSLVFIAVVLIAAFLIARRLSFKQLIAAVFLAAAVIFRIVEGLGEDIGLPPLPQYMGLFDLCPFRKLFMVPGEGSWPSAEAQLFYLTPILTDLAVAFGTGLLWGLLAPVVFKITAGKRYVKISLFILLPVQLTVNLCHLFYLSYSGNFDMGSYILMAAGCALGWIIYKKAASRRKEKKLNDNRD